MQRFENGSEPERVELTFYIPMAKQLTQEYQRRLFRAGRTGSIHRHTGERVDLQGGSVRKALTLNVTVPEGWKNPLVPRHTSIGTNKIVIIVVCALLSGMVVILVVGVAVSRIRNSYDGEYADSGGHVGEGSDAVEPIGDEKV